MTGTPLETAQGKQARATWRLLLLTNSGREQGGKGSFSPSLELALQFLPLRSPFGTKSLQLRLLPIVVLSTRARAVPCSCRRGGNRRTAPLQKKPASPPTPRARATVGRKATVPPAATESAAFLGAPSHPTSPSRREFSRALGTGPSKANTDRHPNVRSTPPASLPGLESDLR